MTAGRPRGGFYPELSPDDKREYNRLAQRLSRAIGFAGLNLLLVVLAVAIARIEARINRPHPSGYKAVECHPDGKVKKVEMS